MTKKNCRRRAPAGEISGEISFHCNTFGEVSGLVHIEAFSDADIVGHKLEGDDGEAVCEMRVCAGNVDCEISRVFDTVVTVGSEAHEVGSAALDFYHVADGFFKEIGLSEGADDEGAFLHEADGAVLELAGGISLGVYIADLFHHARGSIWRRTTGYVPYPPGCG